MSRPENTVFWVLVVRFTAPSSISRLPSLRTELEKREGKVRCWRSPPRRRPGSDSAPLPSGIPQPGPARQTINRCFLFVCLTAMAALFCFLALGFIEFNRIETLRCQKC